MRGPLLPAVLCLLLCAVRGYGQSGPAAAAPGPGLHFAHATCHLGEIPLGRQRDTAFVFGTSAAQALIVSVRTSCSCTGGRYPRKPLQRGERGAIRVRYDARERGSFRRRVTVRYYADGQHRTAQLCVSGTVVDD